jgi:hypothetical protein
MVKRLLNVASATSAGKGNPEREAALVSLNNTLNIPFREDFTYKPQRRKKAAKSLLKQTDVAGADLETVGGNIWIWTATHFDGKEYQDTLVEFDLNDTTLHLKQFIMSHYIHQGQHWSKGGRKGIKVPQQWYFNLKYDEGSIMKMLPSGALETLWNTGHIVIDIDTLEEAKNIQEVKYRWRDIQKNSNGKIISNRKVPTNKYVSIRSIPKKWLKFEPIYWYASGKASLGPIECWDIKQFYGSGSLESNAQATLQDGKVSDINIALAGERSARGSQYRQDNLDNIKQYAIQDSNLTARLAWHKVRQWEEAGVRMNRPYSLASVAERCALDICDIPTLNDIWTNHKWTIKAAWTSYQGGWFESIYHGLCKGVTDLDLKSAYPAGQYWLPDLTDATLIDGDKLNTKVWWDWIDRRQPCSIGFCEADILFPDGLDIYPASKTSESYGCLINAQASSGWFSADEISEFRKWGATMVIGRWFYYIPKGTSYPFRPFIDKFFMMKENNKKGTGAYDVAKVALNSLYGKNLASVYSKEQESRITGNMWNPLYGATITAFTRSRIAEFIRLNNHQGVIGVATDGIIMEDKYPITIPPNPLPITIEGIKSNLGDWLVEMADCDAIILMSGVYSIKSRKPLPNGKHKIKSTFRGNYALFIGRDWPDNWFDFCEQYGDEREVIRDENFKPHQRPYSVGEAQIRGDFDLINQFRIVRQSVKALGDSNKRLWNKRKPKTFSDLAGSRYKSKTHPNMV